MREMSFPTFNDVRRASENGKDGVIHVEKGRSFTVRARKNRKRAWMDFDMHCGNHDIKPEISRAFKSRYQEYCSANGFRPTTYTTFTHKVFSLQVRAEDADEWFASAFRTLTDLNNLERIRIADLFPRANRYKLPSGLLWVMSRTKEGQVVKCNRRVFTRFIHDLTLDYEILTRMNPRDFERAIAAVYARTGCFDRVILTPNSGDEGRDIILEARAWEGRRMIVELKRYRNRRVSAEKVNSLLGVLTGEARGSRAAFLATSDFAPRIKQHRSIRKAVDSGELELLDLVKLVEGCIQSEYCEDPLHFDGKAMS